MNKILIKNDLFDIANRLKSIDEGYVVYFNKETEKYEVHNTKQRGNTLAFVVPYNQLDVRTIAYARYCRVERAKEVLRQMELHNLKLEQQKASEIKNKLLANV
ncbi:MAG: hypothetical protein IJD18_04510 [Clostridia bacterium]|nr:hypothetical protein [Clostridia bacterium]MBQ3067273.1 hypothetical protein [Clostridia bacterium]MBR2966970.1 hypothetical protein [Clostridia bacterium]